MSNPTPVIDITDDLATFLARTNQFAEPNSDLIQQKFNKKQVGATAPVFAALSSNSRMVAQWPNMMDDYVLAFFTAQIGALTPPVPTIPDSTLRSDGTTWVENAGVRTGVGGTLNVDGSITANPGTGVTHRLGGAGDLLRLADDTWQINSAGTIFPSTTLVGQIGSASFRPIRVFTSTLTAGPNPLTVGEAGQTVTVPALLTLSSSAPLSLTNDDPLTLIGTGSGTPQTRYRKGAGSQTIVEFRNTATLGAGAKRVLHETDESYRIQHHDGSGFEDAFAVSERFIERSTTAGITASTTQAQGNGPLTTDVNQVSSVAFVNDTVTLPPAVAGRKITVINDGGNTIQVFPASGDDLGAGVDTAGVIFDNGRVRYQAYDATNWVVL